MRKKKNSKLRSALAIFLAGAMVLGMIPGGMGQVYASDSTPTPAAAFDETSVSDPSTVDTWNQVVKDSTENIGRIWTDKTVLTEDIQLVGGSRPSVKKGDSDFLVGLSALSSTSNTVKTVSRPLDIVLVVDTSGSMDDEPHMGTRPDSERYQYDAVYGVLENWGQVYYTEDGKEITAIGKLEWTGWEFTHWELNGKTVEPKTSPEDSNPDHIQFYEKRDLGTNITKLQALQDAVNNFVEQTAKMNDSIDDVKLQHRVSLVKFASDESNNIGNDTNSGFFGDGSNYSQIVTELQSYTSNNVSSLTGIVNDLTANGATHADFGLNQAQRAFQRGGTREGAQKVVVFFTDGQPTSNSDWSNSVAAAAITNAKKLKDANALIYSIGVFRDANPNDTNTNAGNFNGYMHAVSSNYPDATATSSTRPNSYSCTLGKRTDNSDYYKAATDADELNNIFNEISSDLETGLGFPTQIPTQGYDPGKVGYITFTDQLGEYMQVDEFKSLVFADQIFDPVGEPVTENGVTTYKYEGSATGDTELYPNGNVKDIIVQVKKGADLKTGDTVTVRIPAGLIPLRHFTLDTDSDGNKTLDIQEAYPIRIFYGVSIKPEVRERIADGLNPNDADDEALQQYLNAHNENGVPYFYSNYYNGQHIDPNGKTLGNTIASFQPAKKNTFYYFTEDTPIYTDKDCTMAVKNEPSADQTYYYKRPYVQLNGGQVEEIDGKVAFAGANFQQASANFGINANGEYYIKSGSARLTRVDALIDDKTENRTNTADVVIDPIWDNINNPDYLNVYLGNNGRLALELPGALAISKDARVAANKNLNADEILKDKKFTFEISIPSMKGKTVKAEVRNAQNEIQGKAFELEFDKTGASKYQIKDDETLYIHGLDKDAQYTVTEKELPKGFELTAVDKKADAKEAAGTIISGKSVKHVFENTYDVDEITLAETDFASYEKQFDRWDIADKFRIELIPTTEGAPLPNGAADGKKGVEVTEKNSSGNFGEITFSHPGVYEYEIQEKQPASAIPGVIYSLASYTYRVTVTDNGDGTLSAVAEMQQTAKDDGTSVGDTPIPVENKTAVFVNDFHADSATTSILAKKVYADESGANPLKNGMFEFKLKATGDNAEQAPMPTGEKDENGYIHVVNVGTGITFGNMVFTEENVSDTPWTYEIEEVIPETAVNNGDGTYTLNGITYKAQTYSVSITATTQGTGEDAHIVIEKIYKNAAGEVAEDQVVFNNSYEPKPIVLPGEGESAVKGRKTLVGRDSLVDEEFSFTLSAANTEARTGLEKDFIIFNRDTAQDTMQKTVNGLTNNQAATFDFDSIEFKRPGTYVFSVVENAPENGNGMVYDRHTARVRVIVTDENGELKAETAYYNGEGADTDAAAFVNLYTASATYGTGAELIVEKTLSGRALKAGEFTFKIEAADSDTVNAETAGAKLSDSDREFTNTSGAADGVASRIFDKMSEMQFTQADAGKTFSYVLSEAAGKLPGVTYSTDTYRFDIRVVDNGNGTMHTVTKVTMQGNGVTAEAEYDSSDGKDTIVAAFTNGYHADGVEVDFTEKAALFHKQLVGRDWKESDSFTFTLQAKDGAPMPKDAEGNNVTSVTVSQPEGTKGGTEVPFGFGTITYDTVGEYSYTVTEENAGQTIAGVSYSTNQAELVVKVSDPGDGKLAASVQAHSTKFINKYSASLNLGEAGGLAITKTLTGHALEKNQFEFKVKAVDTDTATAEEAAQLFGFNKGETEVTFKNHEGAADGQTVTMVKKDTNFTLKNLGKVYKYEISEIDGKKPGYTYDKKTYTVELRVTDDGDGTLTLHAKVNDKEVRKDETTVNDPILLAFNNSYAASGDLDGSTKLEVTKNLEGREWIKTDSFSFILEATGDTVQAVKDGSVTLPGDAEELVIDVTDKEHKASFGDIRFTKPGTYTFQVAEVVPKEAADNVLNGITYDSSKKNITVNVTDNHNGTLTAAVADGSDSLTFKNVYKASFVELSKDEQFKVTKNLAGRNWNDTDAFTFTLEAEENAPMPEDGGNVVTARKDAATQTFGKIKYNAVGTYKYRITETVPENKEENMTYDTHAATVTVKVTDDYAVGTLRIESVTYSDGADAKEAQFTNVVGSNTKDVQNAEGDNLDNGMIGVGDELTYVINWVNDGADETGAPAAATVTITDKIPSGTEYVKDSAEGAKYDADARTLTWTIEAKAAQTGSVSFKVRVTDEAGGTEVENAGTITVGNNDPKLTNTVHTTVPGKDSVVEGGGELQVGSVLTYTIGYKNPEAKAATVIITDKIPEGLDYVEGSAGEKASYDAKTKTLTWTVENVSSGEAGTVSFQASVNENAVEKVENKATIQIGNNGPKYETDTDSKPIPKSGTLAINKKIALTAGQGTAIDKNKEFEFTVDLTDTADKPLTKSYVYTISNADGKVSDGKIEHNGKISLKHAETATITGLPAGTKFTVTETAADGYTPSPEGGTITGSVIAEETAKADFTNTYSVTGSLDGAEKLKVTKNFTGREGNRWLESDVFTFILTAAEDQATQDAVKAGLITLPEATEITINGTMAEKQAAFGNITFNIAGTFKFNVTEKASGIAGVTDDADPVREIVVNVADNGDGTLKATVAKESDSLTFTNIYAAGTGESDDIAVQIPATKKLTGRDMKADEFTFEVVTRAAEGTEEFTEKVVAAGTNAAGTDGEAAKVTFAGSDENGAKALSYTTKSLNEAVKAGYAAKSANENGAAVWTVNYTARERTDRLPKGVTSVKGKAEFDFTIVVTDNTNGTLTAEVKIPENGIAFENTYATGGTEVNTDPAESTAHFGKVLNGRDWLDTDAFTFTITPKDGAPSPEGAAEDGTKTVTVTSDSAKEGEAVSFGFGKIRFTDRDMTGAVVGEDGIRRKEFHYTVKENPLPNGKMSGVTIDGHEATLKITVEDDLAGELKVSNIASSNGTFTNSYKSELDYAALGGLQITKVLNGRDMEKDQFTFTMTPKATEGSTTAEEAAEKFGLANAANLYKNEAAGAGTVTTINVLDGKNVTFTQEDAGKTFTYEVAETAGTNTAYTYDTDVRIVTVKVKDNNNSTMTVTTRVTKEKDGQEVIVDEQEVTTGDDARKKATVSFVNTYNDTPIELGGEGSVKINATKTLANRPLTDGEFTFRILDKKGNPVVGKETAVTGTNAADGSITFTPIFYDTDRLEADVKAGIADVDKTSQTPAYVYTYDYTVAEDSPTDGVTGVATTFAVKVIVTDRGDGTLSIEVKYPNGKDSLPFENVYGESANAELALNGKKVYEKESVNAPDIAGKYTFTITGTDELGNPAPMPVKDGVVVTEATNDAAGNIDFGKLVYTMENVFGSADSQDEQTDANQNAEAEQEPTDTDQNAGSGQEPTDTDQNAGSGQDLTDTDQNAGSGQEPTDTDQNAEAEQEPTEEEGKTAAETAAVDKAGSLNAEDAERMQKSTEPRTKVYTYKVTESGSMAGVSNDPAAAEGKTFTVTVTDNGDGTISAVSSWQNDFAFAFTNTYRVNPIDYSVNEHIRITKEMTGRDLHEGEFTFELIDASGNVVATAVNEADGAIRFGTLNYTEAGTYNYVIREAQGTAGGVQYDSAEHTVTVVVTDNGDGTLSAKAETKSSEDIVFRNIYKARPASVTLGAFKNYKGAELKNKQFTFELKDKDGNIVLEAKNGSDGHVVFETLIYDRAGVYEYTISEKNDGQKNVTYDETVYNVTITVTDNGKGNLIAEAVYGDGRTPQFVNTYVKPQDPVKPEQPTPTVKPQNPGAVQTGDHNSFAGTLGMAALALAAAAGVMIRRKKRS